MAERDPGRGVRNKSEGSSEALSRRSRDVSFTLACWASAWASSAASLPFLAALAASVLSSDEAWLSVVVVMALLMVQLAVVAASPPPLLLPLTPPLPLPLPGPASPESAPSPALAAPSRTAPCLPPSVPGPCSPATSPAALNSSFGGSLDKPSSCCPALLACLLQRLSSGSAIRLSAVGVFVSGPGEMLQSARVAPPSKSLPSSSLCSFVSIFSIPLPLSGSLPAFRLLVGDADKDETPTDTADFDFSGARALLGNRTRGESIGSHSLSNTVKSSVSSRPERPGFENWANRRKRRALFSPAGALQFIGVTAMICASNQSPSQSTKTVAPTLARSPNCPSLKSSLRSSCVIDAQFAGRGAVKGGGDAEFTIRGARGSFTSPPMTDRSACFVRVAALLPPASRHRFLLWATSALGMLSLSIMLGRDLDEPPSIILGRPFGRLSFVFFKLKFAFSPSIMLCLDFGLPLTVTPRRFSSRLGSAVSRPGLDR
mmetsp:Transcript_52900/g.120576  ORF Transcript_52900/g.120576 Transcript_52900/m.120576 type:complete len:487 (+) Transcript_52900:454-1914(+)